MTNSNEFYVGRIYFYIINNIVILVLIIFIKNANLDTDISYNKNKMLFQINYLGSKNYTNTHIHTTKTLSLNFEIVSEFTGKCSIITHVFIQSNHEIISSRDA